MFYVKHATFCLRLDVSRETKTILSVKLKQKFSYEKIYSFSLRPLK